MGPKLKMSSSEDSDSDESQQIPEAARVLGGRSNQDMGSHELNDSRGLKQLIRSNVGQAGAFLGRISAAKA